MQIYGAGLEAFLATKTEVVPPFRAQFPWWGADLQTVRNSLSKNKPTCSVDKRILAPIESDAQSINLSVTYPLESTSNGCSVLLVHGLGGDEDSHYKVAAANSLLADGWTIYRMNFRGVGPSKKTSVPPYSAGLTDDLRSAIVAVIQDQPDLKVCALGFSLGGQLLLRTLGEGNVPSGLAAVVTVSAPLNLSHTLKKLQRPRNKIYVDYLVSNMARDLAEVGQQRFGVDPDSLTSVWAFDEHIIAPAFGFKGAEDYYENVSCFPLLENITIPTLAIHSQDDPWIPWEDYRDAKWPAGEIVGCAITSGGGHVGFHCGTSRGVWYEGVAKRFFAEF
ncbi:MAG: YheT family hydrolase [Kordiimonas sp.]